MRYYCMSKKLWLHEFFARPYSTASYCYHSLTLLLILGNAFLNVVMTMEEFEKDSSMITIAFLYECILLTLYSVEYALRLYVCTSNYRYSGFRGRLTYMTTTYMMVDIFLILTGLCTILFQQNTSYFNLLRFARFIQIFRILRFDRSRGDLQIMWRVVHEHRRELITCYFFCFLVLFSGTYIIYVVEKSNEPNEGIDNMVNGLYWGLVTFTTVGYGDFAPKTWAGKICTGIFSLIGCAFFALPAGIIGSGFAIQVSKQRKEITEVKIRNPAASVIQTTWRTYALRNPNLKATWFYMLPQLRGVKDALNNDLKRRTSSIINRYGETNLKYDNRNNGQKSIDSLVRSVNSQIDRSFQFHLPAFVRKKSSVYTTPIQLLGTTEDVYADENTCLISYLHAKFKISVQFIIYLKHNKALKLFEKIRQPFINIEEMLQTAIDRVAQNCSQINDLKNSVNSMMFLQQSLNNDVAEIKDMIRNINAGVQ